MDLITNLKRDKVESKGDLELSSGETIEARDFGKGYKYLGILEADDVLQETMKDVIRKEYYKRIRQLTSGAGIIDWTKGELRVIDRKTRKIMTMNRMYHP